MKPRLILLFVSLLLLSTPSILRAETLQALTQEEKVERRLQFNRFVESELARERAEKDAASQKGKPWNIEASSVYGYETNVDLARSRSNASDDRFWQNTVDGTWKRGDWTWVLSGEHYNYAKRDSTDYTRFVFRPDYNKKLSDKLSLKAEYDLAYIGYENNKSLNSWSQKVKPTLSYQLNPQWAPNLYGSLQWKEFFDRAALTPENTTQDQDREDWLTEFGGGLRYSPDNQRFFGISFGLKQNESNDLYHDLNDYDGYKWTGYGYIPVGKLISLLTYGGLDHKFYDSRTFNESATTQVDDLIYVGGTLTLAWEKNLDIIVSYVYRQNYSSDSTREYVDSTFSGGLKLKF